MSGYQMRLKDLCNASKLSDFVTIHNQTVAAVSEGFICTLPKEKLHAADLAFHANIDLLKPLLVSTLTRKHNL